MISLLLSRKATASGDYILPRKHARKRAKGASPHTPSNKGGNTQARRGALTVAERAEGRALPPPWRRECERGAEPPRESPA